MAGTVKSYQSAVRHAQIAQGLGDPRISAMPRLEYIIKDLKRCTASTSTTNRLPKTAQILRAIKQVWQRDPDRDKTTMLWVTVCTCFFGFLRSGEIVVLSDSDYDAGTHLSYGDVHLDNSVDPQFLEVCIKASKTDPFRKGVQIYLGRTGTDLCPVVAAVNYRVQRGDDSHSSGTRGASFLPERGSSIKCEKHWMRQGLTHAITQDIVSE